MKKLIGIIGLLLSFQVLAEQITVPVYNTDTEALIGEVVFYDSPFGLMVMPELRGLSQGLHGFHIHQLPDCSKKGMAAQGHFDPNKTNSHLGPYGGGHLGDLPVLYANEQGIANIVTLAPRLKVKDIHHLALMVHAGGDNYSNNPPLGGGGNREACGIIS